MVLKCWRYRTCHIFIKIGVIIYSALILLCTASEDCYTIHNEALFKTQESCKQAIHSFVTADYFDPAYLRFDENKLYYVIDTKCISWPTKL